MPFGTSVSIVVQRAGVARALPARLCVARGCASLPGPPIRKKVTIPDVHRKYQRGQKITMCTAYDFPSALHVDAAGIDILLVGDSLSMVQLGHNTTLPVTMDEMIMHSRAVSRGASHPLLVGDMPFGSYEVRVDDAVSNAIRFLKEGRMDVVKMEGASKHRCEAARAIVDAGIGVMGHIGLTPQSVSVLGGFRAQGKTVDAAQRLLEQAHALEEAGCFAIVIECVPQQVAEWLTAEVGVPTIGIGSGPGTSGQVLVYHDLVGMRAHAHHAKVAPRFCKQYAQVGEVLQQALRDFKREVEEGAFPNEEYSPYKMTKAQAQAFETRVLAPRRAPSDDQHEERREAAGDKPVPKPETRPAARAEPDSEIESPY